VCILCKFVHNQRITVLPSDLGSLIMKSMLMHCQTPSNMVKGCNSPELLIRFVYLTNFISSDIFMHRVL
jgi:hypothetical protein